jgi:hypothetical protein
LLSSQWLEIKETDDEKTKERKKKLIKSYKSKIRFQNMDLQTKKKQDNWKDFVSGKGSKKKTGFLTGKLSLSLVHRLFNPVVVRKGTSDVILMHSQVQSRASMHEGIAARVNCRIKAARLQATAAHAPGESKPLRCLPNFNCPVVRMSKSIA